MEIKRDYKVLIKSRSYDIKVDRKSNVGRLQLEFSSNKIRKKKLKFYQIKVEKNSECYEIKADRNW